MDSLSDLKVRYFTDNNKDYLQVTGSAEDNKEVEFYKICLNKFELTKHNITIESQGHEFFHNTNGYSITFPLNLNEDGTFFKVKEPQKMTIEEIEKKLGYKVQIIKKERL